MRNALPPYLRFLSGPAALAILAIGLDDPANVTRAQDESAQSDAQEIPPDAKNTDRARDPADAARDVSTLRPAPTVTRRNAHHHAALGVTLNEDAAGNLYIRRVLPGSPAEEAGLRKGDEILTVDMQRVNHTEELRRALARVSNDTAKLGILRNGRHQTVSAELAVPDEAIEQGNAGSHDRAALGISLDPEGSDGAWVGSVSPHSPAVEAGVRQGDEIVALDGHQVASGDDLMRAISGKHPGDQVTLDIKRNGRERTLEATLARAQDIHWESNPGRSSRMDQSHRNSGYRNAGRSTYDADGNYSNERRGNGNGSGAGIFSSGQPYGPNFWRADRKVTGY